VLLSHVVHPHWSSLGYRRALCHPCFPDWVCRHPGLPLAAHAGGGPLPRMGRGLQQVPEHSNFRPNPNDGKRCNGRSTNPRYVCTKRQPERLHDCAWCVVGVSFVRRRPQQGIANSIIAWTSSQA